MNDYNYDHDFRSRAAELQDIAAMDRLAGQTAPAAALHRYAEAHGGARTSSWSRFTTRVRRVLAHRDSHPEVKATANHLII